MFDLIGSYTETRQRICEDYLNIFFDGIDKRTGEKIIMGELGNLKIKQNYNGFSIRGSLAKYYLNNNLETLTRQTTEKAVEKIADELRIKVSNSRLFKVDIATNFIMKEDIKKYQACLGDLKYMTKSVINESVYYSNSKRQIVFYDKLREMSRKGVIIPKEFKQFKGRLLRYEVRFKKRLKNEFKRILTLSDLYDEDFYIMILDKWKETYFQINKINQINYNKVENLTSKQAFDLIFSKLIIEKGLDSVLSDIDLLKDKFKSGVETSRCKRQIKELISKKKYTESNELIQELDNKVRQAVANYR